MNTRSLDNFMLENLQLSMLFIEISIPFYNLDKIFLLLLSSDSIFHRLSCMLSFALFKYPAFFILLKDFHFYCIKVEWPSEFSNIFPLKWGGQNGWLIDGAAALCAWEVHAAFSMLSKPVSTVPVFLLIFIFYSMPQSHTDMLLYRMVSSVLASRKSRE